jgi:hypothetical protein
LRPQVANQGLGSRIVDHRDRDVHVAGEARLGPDGDGEPPDERPRQTAPIERFARPPKRFQEE